MGRYIQNANALQVHLDLVLSAARGQSDPESPTNLKCVQSFVQTTLFCALCVECSCVVGGWYRRNTSICGPSTKYSSYTSHAPRPSITKHPLRKTTRVPSPRPCIWAFPHHSPVNARPTALQTTLRRPGMQSSPFPANNAYHHLRHGPSQSVLLESLARALLYRAITKSFLVRALVLCISVATEKSPQLLRGNNSKSRLVGGHALPRIRVKAWAIKHQPRLGNHSFDLPNRHDT